MCVDPVTLAIMGASAAVGVVGAAQTSKSQQAAAYANAQQVEEQAAERIKKGEFDAAESAREAFRQRGVVSARIGDSGIDAASFSDIMADDASEAALEREAIRYSSKAEANLLRRQGANFRTQAKDAEKAGYINAATAVVGAAAQGYKAGTKTGAGGSGIGTWTTTISPSPATGVTLGSSYSYG